MTKFEMKDLGVPQQFLGIDVNIKPDKTITLHMSTFITKMLKRFDMFDSRPQQTPMVTRQTDSRTPKSDQTDESLPFRSAIGSLQYVANAARPDISVAVHTLARKLGKHTVDDWISIKRIFRYLKGTITKGLKYEGKGDKIEAFVDASFACNDDSSSISGYIIKAYGGTVCWKTRKQNHVALSSAESEYVAMSFAVREIMALSEIDRRLFKNTTTPVLFEDNTTAIKHSKSDEVPALRHLVKVYLHYIRIAVRNKQIDVKWISTRDQLGDFFTKPLGNTKFLDFRDQILDDVD